MCFGLRRKELIMPIPPNQIRLLFPLSFHICRGYASARSISILYNTIINKRILLKLANYCNGYQAAEPFRNAYFVLSFKSVVAQAVVTQNFL